MEAEITDVKGTANFSTAELRKDFSKWKSKEHDKKFFREKWPLLLRSIFIAFSDTMHRKYVYMLSQKGWHIIQKFFWTYKHICISEWYLSVLHKAYITNMKSITCWPLFFLLYNKLRILKEGCIYLQSFKALKRKVPFVSSRVRRTEAQLSERMQYTFCK